MLADDLLHLFSAKISDPTVSLEVSPAVVTLFYGYFSALTALGSGQGKIVVCFNTKTSHLPLTSIKVLLLPKP